MEEAFPACQLWNVNAKTSVSIKAAGRGAITDTRIGSVVLAAAPLEPRFQHEQQDVAPGNASPAAANSSFQHLAGRQSYRWCRSQQPGLARLRWFLRFYTLAGDARCFDSFYPVLALAYVVFKDGSRGGWRPPAWIRLVPVGPAIAHQCSSNGVNAVSWRA